MTLEKLARNKYRYSRSGSSNSKEENFWRQWKVVVVGRDNGACPALSAFSLIVDR